MKLQLVTAIADFSIYTSSAQQNIWGGSPIISPEIHQGDSVTFRLFAPNINEVKVTGDFLPTQKNRYSLWHNGNAWYCRFT